MKVLDVHMESAGDRVRLTARIEGVKTHPFLAFPSEMESFVSPSADAFVAALLIPCLERGEPLEVLPPVSPQLAARIPHIKDVVLALFPNFHRVEVKVRPSETAAERTGTRVATLFSGGVDSFYSLIKSLAPDMDPAMRPTDLMFMRGLEQRLDESTGADATFAIVEEVAQTMGVGVLWGETNLRMLFGLNYELYYHASALVGSALALSRGVRRLLVPSTFSYGQLIPWGSHPILDELWSTEALEVIHHGAEARRVDKIAGIINHRLAMQRMRVCLKNHAGPNNCGRCQKCARTMMALEILGRLSDVPTFPRVSRETLAHWLCADNPIFVQELYDFARHIGNDEALKFLDRVARTQKRRHAVKALVETMPVLSGMMPKINEYRRRLRGESARIPRAEFLGIADRL